MINIFLGLMETLNNNPLYILETAVKKRQAKGMRIHIPFWVGIPLPYLFLLTIFYFLQNSDPTENFPFYYLLIPSSVIVMLLYFPFKAFMISVSMISGDREKKVYSQIIGSSLTALDIAAGKFWLVFKPIFQEASIFWISFLLPVVFVYFIVDGLRFYITLFFFLIYLSQISTIFAFSLLSLYESVKSRTTLKAGRNGIVKVFLLIGLFLILWTLFYGIIPKTSSDSSSSTYFFLVQEVILKVILFTVPYILYMITAGIHFAILLHNRILKVPEK